MKKRVKRRINIKRSQLAIIIITAILLLMSVAFIHYFSFVTKARDKEVSSQMSEVYSQMNSQFVSLANKNWSLLYDASMAFNLTDDVEKIDKYISQMKQQWKFNEWLFIDKDGTCVNTRGVKGYLNLGNNMLDLLSNQQNIVVDGTLAGSDPIMTYVIPVDASSYKGFEYSAIALAYYKETMVEILQDTTYDGTAQSYLIYPDGRILLQLQDEFKGSRNIFSELKKANFAATDYETVHDKITDGSFGFCRYKLNGKEYYLHYQPVGFQDWILVGRVPQSSVGQYVNQIVEQTVLMSVICFALIIMGIILIMYDGKRRDALKATEELDYRDQLFDILSGTTSNIFMVIAPDGESAEYVSSNCEEVLGIPADKILTDVTVIDSIQDLGITNHYKEMVKLMKDGEALSYEMERRNVRTGKLLYFYDYVYRVKIGDKEKFILLMLDNTAERTGRENLQTALEIAKAANESKSMFLSNMSHDIRTPMNVIIGFLPMLRRDADKPDKVKEYALKIQAAGQHLLNIINDILDMSKIESGKTSLKVEKFRLSEVVEGLTVVIRPQAELKGQDFKVIVRDVRSEYLEGDKTKLNQILMNILSNAVKYTPKDGKITMTVQQLPQLAANTNNIAKFRFVIADNGIGMSEEFQSTIFDTFSREDTKNTAAVQGTGLGMAIVKSLVDLMGGFITINSKLGEGSTFTVELGLRIHHDENFDAFWQEQQIHRSLLIDGDKDICGSVVRAAAMGGLKMDYVVNGEYGFDRVRAAGQEHNPYNLILVGTKQEGLMPAEEISLRIKQMENPPMVLLTGYDRSEGEMMVKDAKADGFLSKPFFISTLKETVERLKSPATRKPDESGHIHSLLDGLHVLIVEDYELNAEILQGTLEMYGVTCDISENGKMAVSRLEKAKPGQYDLVLMDVQMPVMNGYEATREIRKSSNAAVRDIPIIAMSANAFAEDIQKAYDAGMNEYLTKPINVQLVEKTLLRIMNNDTDNSENNERENNNEVSESH